MNPQPGDICLFYNARGLARLISWFTRSRFYHVGLYAGDSCVIESRVPGVIKRDLRAAGERDYVVIPAPENSGPKALRWAEDQLGDRYDLPWVVELVLERLFKNLHINCKPTHDQFSCSELVLCAFRETGTDLLPGFSPDAVVPADFARLLPGGQGIRDCNKNR
jgi:uncharacterized protein YycO